MRSMSTVGLERVAVLLEVAGREADVADLAREHPAEVLPQEQPLDLALGRLDDVGALGVEEPDHHRLGVVLDQADRDAGVGLGAGHREPGHRHRRHLEVAHVDRRRR